MRSLRLFLPALALAVFLVGCNSPTASSSPSGAVVTPAVDTPVVTPAVVVTPTVSTVVPAAAATGVAINSGLSVTFSVAMAPATITTSTFTLVPTAGGAAIAGTVTKPTTTTATFAPTASLTASTQYTATLSTSVKSAAGVALAAAKVWSFTTGTTAAAPTVSLTVPGTAATGVAIGSSLTATFSVLMDPTTITTSTFTLVPTLGGAAIAGTVTNPSTTTATFAPTASLASSTQYTATLSTSVKSAAAAALASAYTWSFTTAAAVTGLNITVDGTLLVPDAAVTAGTVVVNAYLYGAPYTFLGTTGSMSRGATNYTGNIPSLSGYGNAIFRVFVKNSTGNFIYYGESPAQVVSAGTTAPTAILPVSVKTNLAAVNLDAATSQGAYGGAGQYVILGESLVSSAGGDVVTGDIAISPAAATFIQGFSLVLDASTTFSTSSQLTGVSRAYAADYTSPTPANLTQAITNMGTAYTDAAGRPTPDATELGAGDISGMTLVPGLYKWSSAVGINTDVTLNGGPNDIWIMQIANTLTLANGINITLAGGALPQNIFWQSSGNAGVTIGTTAHFQGIVLALKGISVGTSGVVTGRLLSQSAVTLAANATVHP